MMPTKHVKIAVILLAGLLLGSTPGWSRATAPTVLVVPARHTLMQIALDLVRVRGITLVSYRAAEDGTLHLFFWETRRRQWVALPAETSLGPGYRFTAIVGSNREQTTRVAEAAAWPAPIHEIPTLDLAEIMNQVHGVYVLTPGEWRWFAARYGLQLEDQNYLRRKYGRYGPPGQERPARPVPPPVGPAPGGETLEIEAPVSEDRGIDRVSPATVEPREAAGREEAEEALPVTGDEWVDIESPHAEEKGAPPPEPGVRDIEPEMEPARDVVDPADDTLPEDK